MADETFSTQDAAKQLGVSRNTLLRWFREQRVEEPARDFRGWRCFTQDDIQRIQDQLESGQFQKHAKKASAQPRTTGLTALSQDQTSPQSPRLAFLRQVHLFTSLADSDLAALDAIAEYRGYPRGAILFHEDQAVLGLHVLLKGRIKLTKLSPDGREQILEIVEPVSTFAEPSLFDKNGRYPTLGRASTVSSVLTIPAEPMKQLIKDRPGLSVAFLGAFAERMKDLMRKVEEATFLTVDQRLARYIRKEAKDDRIDHLNLAEIAAIIGAARESVSRALGRLSKAGIVELRPGRLLVNDDQRLARIA